MRVKLRKKKRPSGVVRAPELNISQQENAVVSQAPPYLPWKTFESFVAGFAGADRTIPNKIDGSVFTSNISGSTRGTLVSALRFLRFIDKDGYVSDAFSELIGAYKTDEWNGIVKRTMVPRYKGIVQDLPVKNATVAQLESCFRQRGSVSGQMLDKAIRFYLHTLRQSATPYSSLFSMRKVRHSANSGTKRKVRKVIRRSPRRDGIGGHAEQEPPSGYTEFPLRGGRKVIVPADLTSGDVRTITAYLQAYAGEDEG